MLRAFPFTIVTFVIYNAVIIFSDASVWADVLFEMELFSGVEWAFTWGDLMVIGGLVILLAEVLRATTIEKKAITNHIVSVVVLLIYVVEFVVVGEAGTSTFFILTVIALIDVLAGVVVTIRLATRDFSYEGRAGFHPHE